MLKSLLLYIIYQLQQIYISQALLAFLKYSFFSLHRIQFGIRANHLTETQATLEQNPKHEWTIKVVRAMFLSLWTAFNTVRIKLSLEFSALLNSTHNLSKMFTLYVSEYIDESYPLGLSTGVPQDFILGPVLLSMYINDFYLIF